MYAINSFQAGAAGERDELPSPLGTEKYMSEQNNPISPNYQEGPGSSGGPHARGMVLGGIIGCSFGGAGSALSFRAFGLIPAIVAGSFGCVDGAWALGFDQRG